MTAWFVPEVIDDKNAAPIRSPVTSAGGPPRVGGASAGAAVKHLVAVAAAVLIACSAMSQAQPVATVAQAGRTPQEQTGSASADAAPSDGLSALDAMTFSCVKAGLNAAAREAAKVRSQGTYQFAYLKIVNDTHHASYEVHFKSNYEGEADLKYCVAMYCQQGWNPQTTKAEVSLIGRGQPRMGTAAHTAGCGMAPAPVKPSPKRPVKQ